MSRGAIVLLVMAAALGMAQLPFALAVEAETDAPRSRYIVGFHGWPPDSEEFGHGTRSVRVDPVLRFAVLETSRPEGLVAALRRNPDVRYIEADGPARLLFVPNDPLLADQYGPAQVNATGAWRRTMGEPTRGVCPIDSGVRYTHEDLILNAGLLERPGLDQNNNEIHGINGSLNPWDEHGHGTHVAGIIAATVDDGVGIAGLSQSRLVAVKTFDRHGNGDVADIATAIRWCADNGGHVISMSFSAFVNTPMQDAIRYAWEKGSLLVAAAGNGGCENCVAFPARDPHVIAVGCTTPSGTVCALSSRGPEVDLVAPGWAVLSTCFEHDGSYCSMSGTSMSTPHVAGVAALAWTAHPETTNARLRDALLASARDIGPGGHDPAAGFGIVDAGATLDALRGDDPSRLPHCEFQDLPTGRTFQGTANILVRAGSTGAEIDSIKVSIDSGRWNPLHETEEGDLFSMRLDTAAYPDGTHGIEVVCKDAMGRTAQIGREILVRNQAPLAVSILAPKNGTRVLGATHETIHARVEPATTETVRVQASINGRPWIDLRSEGAGEYMVDWDPLTERFETNIRVRAIALGATSVNRSHLMVTGVDTVREAAMKLPSCVSWIATNLPPIPPAGTIHGILGGLVPTWLVEEGPRHCLPNAS